VMGLLFMRVASCMEVRPLFYEAQSWGMKVLSPLKTARLDLRLSLKRAFSRMLFF